MGWMRPLAQIGGHNGTLILGKGGCDPSMGGAGIYVFPRGLALLRPIATGAFHRFLINHPYLTLYLWYVVGLKLPSGLSFGILVTI
jgi:hypothetical protein